MVNIGTEVSLVEPALPSSVPRERRAAVLWVHPRAFSIPKQRDMFIERLQRAYTFTFDEKLASHPRLWGVSIIHGKA